MLFIHLFTPIEGPMTHHPKCYSTFYDCNSYFFNLINQINLAISFIKQHECFVCIIFFFLNNNNLPLYEKYESLTSVHKSTTTDECFVEIKADVVNACIKLRLNQWSHMDYFNDVITTFLGLECASCVDSQCKDRNLSDFIKISSLAF